MTMPKSVSETIAALRQERIPLASRLDAIDLAIDNLQRIFGIHGDQPRLIEGRRAPKAIKRKPQEATDGRSTEASERRDTLLRVIERAEHGITGRDLRKATASMEDKDRSNALSVLRLKGQIKRAGNVWVKAA